MVSLFDSFSALFISKFWMFYPCIFICLTKKVLAINKLQVSSPQVDEGKISEEEAFDHPDGNIISKALGDNGNKAEPEIRVYDVYSRDVFMLCSDGLCGLLQDSELNDIISRDCTSSKETLNTIIICLI